MRFARSVAQHTDVLAAHATLSVAPSPAVVSQLGRPDTEGTASVTVPVRSCRVTTR